jgi:hypothetical protein
MCMCVRATGNYYVCQQRLFRCAQLMAVW